MKEHNGQGCTSEEPVLSVVTNAPIVVLHHQARIATGGTIATADTVTVHTVVESRLTPVR